VRLAPGEDLLTLPPGPLSPPWVQAKAWIERPVQFWEECAATFGNTFTIQLGSVGPTILFSDPHAVQQIFQLPAESYECRQFNEHYKYVMGEHSLLLSDGSAHRRRRRLLLSPLHHNVNRFANIVESVCQEVIARWPDGKAFMVRPSLHELSLRIVLQIVFGGPDDPVAGQISDAFTSVILKGLGTWSPWTRFGRLQAHFRDLIQIAIADRRRKPNRRETVFDDLIETRDKHGELLGNEEIQDHIFTMLVAGVDPAAIAIAWGLHWLLACRTIKAKLQQELSAVDHGGAQRFLALPYLNAVCHEALRMYPVVATPSGRKLKAPAYIMDRAFGAGATLVPCTYLVHHRSDLYPDASRFQPERFLGRTYSAYEYFPFGGGGRICIGAALAMLEMKVALGTMLSTCSLESATEGTVTPVRHGTLLAPSDNLMVSCRSSTLGRVT
jgi:unspecific monooxygenase